MEGPRRAGALDASGCESGFLLLRAGPAPHAPHLCLTRFDAPEREGLPLSGASALRVPLVYGARSGSICAAAPSSASLTVEVPLRAASNAFVRIFSIFGQLGLTVRGFAVPSWVTYDPK